MILVTTRAFPTRGHRDVISNVSSSLPLLDVVTSGPRHGGTLITRRVGLLQPSEERPHYVDQTTWHGKLIRRASMSRRVERRVWNGPRWGYMVCDFVWEMIGDVCESFVSDEMMLNGAWWSEMVKWVKWWWLVLDMRVGN